MKIISVNRNNYLAKADSVATTQGQLPVEWAMSTYAPGFPIQPFVSAKETEVPREIDYPISINATLQPRTGYGLMPFSFLRDVYETITEVRMPVNTSLRHLTGFQPKLVDDDGNEIDDHPYAWITRSPDNAMPFDVWLTRFMKSSDVFDAGTFSIEWDGDNIKALHYLDGSTLFIIVDEHGRIPKPNSYDPAVAQTSAYAKKLLEYNSLHPGKLRGRLTKAATGNPMVLTPAFVQVIKGTPFAWYTSNEIWYKPRSTRYDSPYGETFIEMAWSWIMIIANITGFELAHYREGNMPEGWWESPEGWTLDRIAAYEAAWNSRMSSGPAERMRSRFAMAGMKWHETKKADFPEKLYQKAFNNLILTFGYPPSEFGEMSGKGLGGKDLGDLLQDKTFRNAIVPRKVYVEDAINDAMRMAGVDDVTLELELPQQNLDPEKEKQGVYDGVAHGVFTPNDALGRLGMDPMEGSMIANPDGSITTNYNHIGNKHLIIAGTTVYVLEDLKEQDGVAVAPFAAKPGAQPEIAAQKAIEARGPQTERDFADARELAKKILDIGALPNTKTYSIPSAGPSQELTRASGSLPPNIDEEQYIMGLKEEQEHSGTVGGDQSVISNIVLDHLREDPQYYTHLRSAHKQVELPGHSEVSQVVGLLNQQAEFLTEELGANGVSSVPQSAHKDMVPSADSVGEIVGHLNEHQEDLVRPLSLAAADLAKPYIVHGTTVVNEDTGKPVPGGHHDTKAEADAHARALYANVPDASKVVKLTKLDLKKHCGVCPEDEAYFGAPISNEFTFDVPVGGHANDADIVAMTPDGLPPKPAVWKPEGGELEGLRALVGGPLYVRDEAAYLLDQSLGFALVPVSYVAESNGEMGSVIFWSIGSSFAKPAIEYAPDWVEKAAVFDYISSQMDRNTGNWLTHPDDPGRMILIDNSVSFPVDPSIYTDSPFAIMMKGKPLSPGALAAIRTFVGDIATQRDMRDLIGAAATSKALACAQRLLDNGTLTVAGAVGGEGTDTTESTFTSSPATDVEFNDSNA